MAMAFASSYSATNEKVLRLKVVGGYLLVNSVDWYRPIADSVNTSGWATVYNDLMVVVPDHLHNEAATLLANADVIELTREQAKHFGFRRGPDSILRSLIQQGIKDRSGYQQMTEETKSGRREFESAHFAREALQADQWWIDHHTIEIKRHQAWIGRLKPYLIKSVMFQEGHQAGRRDTPETIDGILGPRDLVTYFGSSGVTSRSRFRMMRIPVVAYLPIKPGHVYTDMRLMW